jgi:hypothetical protein
MRIFCAADGGMCGQAVFAFVLLGQRQRDTLAGGGVQRTVIGDVMQSEEGFQGIGRVGEYPQEIRHHTQLALDRIQQAALFSVGAFVTDGGNAAHDGSPNNERGCHTPVRNAAGGYSVPCCKKNKE